MPLYDYLCDGCGPFSAVRPMAEFAHPQPCEGCGQAAPRAILTAPAFAGMDAGVRRAHATNERSASTPRRGKRHAAGCGCCSGKKSTLQADAPAAAKSFPTKRPWMISH